MSQLRINELSVQVKEITSTINELQLELHQLTLEQNKEQHAAEQAAREAKRQTRIERAKNATAEDLKDMLEFTPFVIRRDPCEGELCVYRRVAPGEPTLMLAESKLGVVGYSYSETGDIEQLKTDASINAIARIRANPETYELIFRGKGEPWS